MPHQVDTLQASGFLEEIINYKGNEEELNWLHQQKENFHNNFKLSSFYFAFSSASRYIRKEPLRLRPERLAEAGNLREGWQPESWSLLQMVRVYLLLMLPNEKAEDYEKNLTRLYESADMEEQITLYKALPLLGHPESMAKRAAEGIRTNITDVFDAIALQNPYPKDFLDQDAWNQMILKAVFMQRPLYKIYGAHERANPELARMLVDFAHERWAAHRLVSPELWQFVGLYLDKDYISDIEKVLEGDSLEFKAGLLACASSEHPEAQEILKRYPDLKNDIENGQLNWVMIGSMHEKEVERK